MGSDDADAYAADGEGPVRRVGVEAFRIGACTVTNTEFAAFAEATGYLTWAGGRLPTSATRPTAAATASRHGMP